MDYSQPKRISRNIQKVLRNYQSTAVRSLCGPDSSIARTPTDLYYYYYPSLPTAGPSLSVSSQIQGVSGSNNNLLLSHPTKFIPSPVGNNNSSRNSLTPNSHNSTFGAGTTSSADSSRAGSVSPTAAAGGGASNNTAGPTSPKDKPTRACPSSASSSSPSSSSSAAAVVSSSRGRPSSGPSSVPDDEEEVLVYDPHLSSGGGRRGAMSSSSTSTTSGVVVNPVTSKLPSEKGLEFDPFRSPPPYPIQQMPVFTPYDSYAERSETLLENERIACFIIGGEKRLCLPQILNSVLRHFNLSQINTVCDDLHIFCARCSPEQLEVFVAAGILPCRTASCGLITKTDAERLCHALLYKRAGNKPIEPPSHTSFKVYHECFGKSKGIFQPDLYKSPESECIYCAECNSLFNPPQFVCHSHTASENRICHWGFDSAHWRNYLMLAKDQENLEKCQEMIEQMKNKFDGCKSKRKSVSTLCSKNSQWVFPERGRESAAVTTTTTTSLQATPPPLPRFAAENVSDEWISSKRVKTEENPSQVAPWSPHHSAATTIAPVTGYSWPQGIVYKDTKFMAPSIMRDSLPGRNVPSFLQTGPPVLLHPERVVPHSESARYERHFTPNVSLAPLPQQRIESKIKTESKDSELERNGLHQLAEAAVSKISKEPVALTTDTKILPETNLSKVKEKAYEYMSDSDESITEFEETIDEPLSPKTEDTYDLEMEMVKQALNGQVGDSPEAKRKFLSEFTNLRTIHQDRINTIDRCRHELRGKLSKLKRIAKGKVTRCIEKKKRLRKKLEDLRIESECRLHQAEEENDRLHNRIDSWMKEIEPKDLHHKYIQATKDLHLQVQHYESIFESLNRENAILQEELRKRGITLQMIQPNPNTLGPPPPSASSSGLHHSPLHLILSSPSSKSPTSPEKNSPPSRSSHTVDRIKILYSNRNKTSLNDD